MDTAAATHLAAVLNSQQASICTHVATRLIRTFPEILRTLRLEEAHSPAARLSKVAVEQLNVLVRAMLQFEVFSIADHEIDWAAGVLPRSGVTSEYQMAMVRWFFEEVRRLDLSASEVMLAREIEHYLLNQIRQSYQTCN